MTAAADVLVGVSCFAAGFVVRRLIARWLVRRALALAHQLGAAAAARAIPFRRCVRDCGRPALDGHLTCGQLACDERRARDEAAIDQEPPAMKPRICTVCGCTDDDACQPDNCHWVSLAPPICSACIVFLDNIRSTEKRRTACKFFGVPPSKVPAVAAAPRRPQP